MFSLSGALAANPMPPNIILINADDLGIGLLGCYGQQLIKTPHIDRLASEGMKFNNYYGGVFCAPSRWTLLTGMHDGRIGGWSHNGAGALMALDKKKVSEPEYTQRFNARVDETYQPIPENEIFLAEVARQGGYATAQFGKLDVGFLTNHERVKRFGWDYYEGYYSHSRCHGFYPPYLWRNGEKFHLKGNKQIDCGKMTEQGDEPVGSGGETYSQDVFIDGILKYIRERGALANHGAKPKPFFLYVATQLPHGPVAIPELHPDFAEITGLSLAEKKYASMVKMLDDHVGLIIQELRAQEIDKNTIVLFTSDNGHELYYGPKKNCFKRDANGEKTNLSDNKWRTSEGGDVFNGAGGRAGLKRTTYQGGIQCPLLVRWPGKIQPGTETTHLSAHYDFMATLAEIAGVEVPEGKDSISYLPTLLGKRQAQSHDHIIVNNRFNKMARSCLIHQDGWKLVEVDRDKDLFQLYNLNEDVEERYDLSAQYPEKVERLKLILLRELDSERPDLAIRLGGEPIPNR